MDAKSPSSGPLKLELVDDVPPAVTPKEEAAIDIVTVDAMPRTVAPDIDPYLAQATRERETGKVDEALWARALELANGDAEEAVAPYLRARAAMIKIAHSRRQAAARGNATPAPKPVLRAEPDARPRRLPGVLGARPLLLAAVGVIVVAVTTVVLLMTGPDPDAVKPVVVAPAPVRVAAPAAVPAAAPVNPAVELAEKVAALKKAANWNVLVLYANEWTRKDPNNAAAWAELSGGLAKLNQIDESFEAAKKAVALDGNNPAYLRQLAEVYVGLERPADALVHLEKAMAVDGNHADSLAQAGALYVQLGKLIEAKTAFERALALDPTNTVASCGALDVARRQGRAKDAEALAKALKAAEYDCGEFVPAKAIAAAPAPVPAASSVPVRAAAPARRP